MKSHDPKRAQRLLERVAREIEAQNEVLRRIAQHRGDPALFGDAIAFRPVKAAPAMRGLVVMRA